MKRWVVRFFSVVFVALILYIGMLFFGFVAVRYGWTNTSGAVDENNQAFEKFDDKLKAIEVEQQEMKNPISKGATAVVQKVMQRNLCQIDAIGQYSPVNAKDICECYDNNKDDIIAAKMILAASMRLKENLDFNQVVSACETQKDFTPLELDSVRKKYTTSQGPNLFTWSANDEWSVIEEAILKDKTVIERVAQETGVEPRMIVASLIVEQLRLYNTQRALFKSFFQPLKILGTATKYSWGVMGIKEATAIDIENHLKDPASSYYLGAEYEHFLDFKTGDPAKERYVKLTNDKNHYYAYLYGGLYLKQFQHQWESAGYSIKYRPEIMATLFNIGFSHSKPKENPQVGGAEIEVNGVKYSFGSLAYEFYYSGQLQKEFPFIVK